MKNTSAPHLSRNENRLAAAIISFLAGALVGLVAGWVVPAVCLVMYFHLHREIGDAQNGLIVLFTAPLGAIIGGVVALRLRRWWGWGIGAIFGLGPGGLVYIRTMNPIPALLTLLVCACGGHLIRKVTRNRTQMETDHRKRPSSALLVAVLFGGMFAGCSKSPIEKQILGAWKDDSGLELTYQFSKAGRWSSKQVLPRMEHSRTGSWKVEGQTVVITTETSNLVFDGKPKPSPGAGQTERSEIVTVDSSALVLKMRNRDGQEELAHFHRVRGN